MLILSKAFYTRANYMTCIDTTNADPLTLLYDDVIRRTRSAQRHFLNAEF